MSDHNAWILDFGNNCNAAIGAPDLLHLLDAHSTFHVPCTPVYCHQVVAWQGQLLPVMDVALRLGGCAQSAKLIAIVGYQQKRGINPEFAALLLSSPPIKTKVSDAQACRLPEQALAWREVSISCFEVNDEAVPILDLYRLFNSFPT